MLELGKTWLAHREAHNAGGVVEDREEGSFCQGPMLRILSARFEQIRNEPVPEHLVCAALMGGSDTIRERVSE